MFSCNYVEDGAKLEPLTNNQGAPGFLTNNLGEPNRQPGGPGAPN